MITRIKSDKIIIQNGVFDGFVYITDGKISEVTKQEKACDFEFDYTGLYVSPGFIDIHTHGAGGYCFLNSSEDDVVNGCNFHLKYGTTTILPTVSASPFAEIRKSVADIAAAIKSGRCLNNVLGAHIEGPYLSANQCGAQCPDFITAPIESEYKTLVEQYGKYIKRWTYAPENDADGAFCKYITSHNIIASAGHTDAKYEDIMRAQKNGCNLVTHLYSCTSTVTRDKGFRSLGVIESAFLMDELFVEIIADGRHLPKELVQMIIKIKGTDKVAFITDSLEIAGTDIKEGFTGGTHFIVEDGVCKLRDRSAFAGSVATADRLIRFVVKECLLSVSDAVKMLTEVPASILGVKKGVITEGYDADIVVFDDDILVTDVFVSGKHINF